MNALIFLNIVLILVLAITVYFYRFDFNRFKKEPNQKFNESKKIKTCVECGQLFKVYARSYGDWLLNVEEKEYCQHCFPVKENKEKAVAFTEENPEKVLKWQDLLNI